MQAAKIKENNIPERWLYWTYRDPALLKTPLETTDGQSLRILNPGRLNEDNGPDFLDAELEIGGVRCRGDVEFHVTPEAWFRHGHHQDARYRNVLVHIVWEAPNDISEELAERFPHVILNRQLALPGAEWRERMVSLEHHTARQCREILPAIPLSQPLIARYAEARFDRKISRVREWLRYFSPEDCLYIIFAETLGYAKNKFPLRQLLWETPPSQVYNAISPMQRSPLSIWVYLVLRANLLPDIPGFIKQKHKPSLNLPVHWQKYFRERGVCPLLQKTDWHFSRLRPLNSPYLRLAALAQLLYHYQSPALFQQLLNTAMERPPAKIAAAQWKQALQIPFDTQIANSLGVLFQYKQLPRYTIGTLRLKQFFINGLLPLLTIWAQQRKSEGFRIYLSGLYETFPSAEDAGVLSRQLQQVGDAALAKMIRKSAYLQQGMLEIMSR